MVYRGPCLLSVVLVGSAPTLSPPVSSTRKTLEERQVVQGEGGGRGAESYDREKAWSSIILLLLSEVKRRNQCANMWTASPTRIFSLGAFSHLVLLYQRFNFRATRFQSPFLQTFKEPTWRAGTTILFVVPYRTTGPPDYVA
jgi:hypothetical protein